MERLFAILVAATAILPATAQLKVTGSGQVQVGRQQSGSGTICGSVLNISNPNYSKK